MLHRHHELHTHKMDYKSPHFIPEQHACLFQSQQPKSVMTPITSETRYKFKHTLLFWLYAFILAGRPSPGKHVKSMQPQSGSTKVVRTLQPSLFGIWRGRTHRRFQNMCSLSSRAVNRSLIFTLLLCTHIGTVPRYYAAGN